MSRSTLATIRKAVSYACLPLAYPSYRLFPAVRILMYHRVARLPSFDQLTVTPERFEQQIATLVSQCRVISLAQAVTELESGGPRTPAVALTFDDGYRDNLVHALPVMQRHGLPATIFLTARFVDGDSRHPRYPDESGQLHLSWQDVLAMAAQPGITFGSHTLTHPFLSRLDDAAAAREISDSRKELAQRLGSEVEFFCYPSGDLTERERRLVASAGYRAAVSVCPGVNRDASERYALRRTEITDRDGPEELRMKLFGAYDLVHGILHRRRERNFGRARAEMRGAGKPGRPG
jgi:peptidoglycan/xylan/chitin deacetylase (PgdA/CDA1 family)